MVSELGAEGWSDDAMIAAAFREYLRQADRILQDGGFQLGSSYGRSLPVKHTFIDTAPKRSAGLLL